MSGHTEGAPKLQIANLVGSIGVIVLIVCIKSDMHGSYKLIMLS